MIVSILGPVDNPAKVAQLSDELNELCAEITWDEEVRVVILSGAEEITFPAGGRFEGSQCKSR